MHHGRPTRRFCGEKQSSRSRPDALRMAQMATYTVLGYFWLLRGCRMYDFFGSSTSTLPNTSHSKSPSRRPRCASAFRCSRGPRIAPNAQNGPFWLQRLSNGRREARNFVRAVPISHHAFVPDVYDAATHENQRLRVFSGRRGRSLASKCSEWTHSGYNGCPTVAGRPVTSPQLYLFRSTCSFPTCTTQRLSKIGRYKTLVAAVGARYDPQVLLHAHYA
jgi:hypothetical protein